MGLDSIPVAILPLGTGNGKESSDLARTIEILISHQILREFWVGAGDIRVKV